MNVHRDSIDTFPEQVATQLEAAIRAGEFRPGQQLVPATIGLRYGTSGKSTYRAFRILVSKGLLTIRSNSGSFVTWPGPERP